MVAAPEFLSKFEMGDFGDFGEPQSKDVSKVAAKGVDQVVRLVQIPVITVEEPAEEDTKEVVVSEAEEEITLTKESVMQAIQTFIQNERGGEYFPLTFEGAGQILDSMVGLNHELLQQLRAKYPGDNPDGLNDEAYWLLESAFSGIGFDMSVKSPADEAEQEERSSGDWRRRLLGLVKNSVVSVGSGIRRGAREIPPAIQRARAERARLQDEEKLERFLHVFDGTPPLFAISEYEYDEENDSLVLIQEPVYTRPESVHGMAVRAQRSAAEVYRQDGEEVQSLFSVDVPDDIRATGNLGNAESMAFIQPVKTSETGARWIVLTVLSPEEAAAYAHAAAENPVLTFVETMGAQVLEPKEDIVGFEDFSPEDQAQQITLMKRFYGAAHVEAFLQKLEQERTPVLQKTLETLSKVREVALRISANYNLEVSRGETAFSIDSRDKTDILRLLPTLVTDLQNYLGQLHRLESQMLDRYGLWDVSALEETDPIRVGWENFNQSREIVLAMVEAVLAFQKHLEKQPESNDENTEKLAEWQAATLAQFTQLNTQVFDANSFSLVAITPTVVFSQAIQQEAIQSYVETQQDADIDKRIDVYLAGLADLLGESSLQLSAQNIKKIVASHFPEVINENPNATPNQLWRILFTQYESLVQVAFHDMPAPPTSDMAKRFDLLTDFLAEQGRFLRAEEQVVSIFAPIFYRITFLSREGTFLSREGTLDMDRIALFNRFVEAGLIPGDNEAISFASIDANLQDWLQDTITEDGVEAVKAMFQEAVAELDSVLSERRGYQLVRRDGTYYKAWYRTQVLQENQRLTGQARTGLLTGALLGQSLGNGAGSTLSAEAQRRIVENAQRLRSDEHDRDLIRNVAREALKSPDNNVDTPQGAVDDYVTAFLAVEKDEVEIVGTLPADQQVTVLRQLHDTAERLYGIVYDLIDASDDELDGEARGPELHDALEYMNIAVDQNYRQRATELIAELSQAANSIRADWQ